MNARSFWPISPKPVIPIPVINNSRRSRLFGVTLVVLLVFSAIVIAGYFLQRKAAGDALAFANPSSIHSASSSPTASSVPTATPVSSAYDFSGQEELTRQWAAEDQAKQKPSQAPITEPNLEEYLDPQPAAPPQAPTPTTTDQPRPRSTPRIEHVVSASDVLMAGYYGGKSQDSRRYRFRLDGIARVRGSFSAGGGGVSVRIVSGSSTYYSSENEGSADTIDVALYSGTYEVEVTLNSRATVRFSVRLVAYYNP